MTWSCPASRTQSPAPSPEGEGEPDEFLGEPLRRYGGSRENAYMLITMRTSSNVAAKSRNGRKHRHTVYFEPQLDGTYNVVFPGIPEIVTFGRSLEEARRMASDALRCHL